MRYAGTTLCTAATGLWALAMLGAIAVSDPCDQSVRPVRFAEPINPPGRVVPLVGMTLNVYHATDFQLYLEATDRIAELGCNALQVVTPVFQRNGGSPQVETAMGPGRGPGPEALITLLRYARSKGLHTTLMPQVNLTEPRGNEWRGKIHPPRWAPWWQSYRRAVEHFLAVAVAADVDLFSIGCELVTTENPQHVDQWRRIIRDCRARFEGQLTYSTVWNHYQSPGFWDQVDLIGVSGYWDLTWEAQDPHHPRPGELARCWQQIQEQLFAFVQEHGRPLLIMELGYPALPWALKDPWNYINSNGASPDVDAQAVGYQAFLAAWGDLLRNPDPRFGGVHFYKWDIYQRLTTDDTGYGIEGRPAYEQLSRWLTTMNSIE